MRARVDHHVALRVDDIERSIRVESPDGHVFELMEADTAGTVLQISKTIALLAEQDAGAG